MAKLTHEMLGQYLDGELSRQEAERMKSAIVASVEDKRTLDEWSGVGALLRIMDKETTADITFEGLSDKILAEIKTNRTTLPFIEKMKSWFAEFFEHRRAVWIPAAAVVGAMCLSLAMLPLFGAGSPAARPSSDSGIVLHSAAPASKGSRIAAVDFGLESGMQYSLDDGTGATVGVVWIVEK